MHAPYVRAWFLAGLVALALCVPAALVPATRALLPALLGAALAYLALAVALGLLPAFARRDWPSPVYAWAGVALGGLAVGAFLEPRLFHALLGASLLVGALQPLALLLSPRWDAAPDAPHRHGDRVALASVVLALVSVGVGGLLLVALPRGLPNAGLAALLLAAAPAAALAALLFTLPRQAREPLQGATLASGALAALALGAGALAFAFARPVGASFRTPVALVALAHALAIAALLRAHRPPEARPLLRGAFALALLAPLALLLATLYDAPNALLPVALFAQAALGLVLLAGALVLAAPLLLPGRAREGRWRAWAPALLIAALFLFTPALQYGRSAAPAALVAAVGIVALLRGLAPLASSAQPRMRRR